jgi:hypothetical protein
MPALPGVSQPQRPMIKPSIEPQDSLVLPVARLPKNRAWTPGPPAVNTLACQRQYGTQRVGARGAPRFHHLTLGGERISAG